jgi:hypothetical protein
MPEILTYSLRSNHANSDAYYQSISAFRLEVLEQSLERVPALLADFLSWSERSANSMPRKQEEAVFELITLGVLWRIYSGSAVASRNGVRRLLSWLTGMRKKSRLLKPVVDLLRGWLSSLLSFYKKSEFKIAEPNLVNLDILLEWLAASGEFSEDVKRLSDWRAYLADQVPDAITAALQKCMNLAEWFEILSLERLGEYTSNVDRFLVEIHPNYRWREDNLFTGRQRVEYHLNMLGTEILNHSLREGFNNTAMKIVIAPPCMKAKRDEDCLATPTPYGDLCANCTPGCHVNQLTRLGQKHGFQVFIIPDELKTFSGDAREPSAQRSFGVVGISCPLTNAPGGWEMQRIGVPAQGLLLDYCGCSYHWHKDGIPTNINFQQLLRLLEGSSGD